MSSKTIFLCAGHHNNDSGAIGIDGVKESDLTKELRDLIASELGDGVWLDSDGDHLSQVVMKIVSLSKEEDIVCDLHFNAYDSPSACGCEVIVANKARDVECELAQKLVDKISEVLGIKNRGVKTESDSHRGQLAMMRPKGINVLIEVCFITNENDLKSYLANKDKLASSIAEILKEYAV